MSKILLIEDDRSTRFLLATLLEEAEHEVLQAADGTAVDELAAADCDLIVTDLFMPGREGLETIRTLRRSHHVTPILAISVGTIQGHEMDFLKAARAVGANGALRKPFSPAEFMAEVARLLAGAGDPSGRDTSCSSGP